jgi:hypothetical protein
MASEESFGKRSEKQGLHPWAKRVVSCKSFLKIDVTEIVVIKLTSKYRRSFDAHALTRESVEINFLLKMHWGSK